MAKLGFRVSRDPGNSLQLRFSRRRTDFLPSFFLTDDQRDGWVRYQLPHRNSAVADQLPFPFHRHAEMLKVDESLRSKKTELLDLSSMLKPAHEMRPGAATHRVRNQDHKLHLRLDNMFIDEVRSFLPFQSCSRRR